MFRQGRKTERIFSPIYLAIFSGILLVILIINGLLEINRTRKGFYLLVEREGIALLQHFEKNIEDILVSLQRMESPSGSAPLSGASLGLDESIGEYLIEAAYRVDQIDAEKPLTSSDARSLMEQYSVTSIEIYDLKGNFLRGWPSSSSAVGKQPFLQELIEKKRSVFIDLFGKPLSEDQWFSVALMRKAAPGIIVFHLSGEQMKMLFQQFAIQRAVSDITLGEGILYVSVQDAHYTVLTHTDPSLIGRRQEDPFLRSALQNDRFQSRHSWTEEGEEIFEVVKSFSIDGEPMGLIRIGYSQKEIYPVLNQIRKNVAVSVLIFLVLGISAIALIWVNQNRHLRRMREMEDQVQRAERLSSLGHLAAGVAHEIRNPLNAIGMGLQRLKREFLPQDGSKKEEYLSFTEVIFKEVRRVNEIIEQFLTLSRPFQIAPKLSSLQDLLKNLITLFQEEASLEGIAIQREIDSEIPPIKIDAERLTQALMNIMKNGMEAMKQRGGILGVKARFLRNHVEVTVSDSGSGISPDQMGKIFNYYYTTKEGGMGLGLPIAHRIVEAHGGQIKVESRVGGGTTVTLTLPI